jgi:phage gp46-like protein
MTTRFTDFALAQDAEGIWDLVIDEDAGDIATVDGFETALVVSLLTDRRAHSDEVADPLLRRGWDGDLYPEAPGDNTGSGWWLYEQARLSSAVEDDTRVGMYYETVQALEWLIEEALALAVDATFVSDPKHRRLIANTLITAPDGGVSRRAWQLWQNTGSGTIRR